MLVRVVGIIKVVPNCMWALLASFLVFHKGPANQFLRIFLDNYIQKGVDSAYSSKKESKKS